MGTASDDTLMEYYKDVFGENTPETKRPRILTPDELLPPARTLYEANLRALGVDAIPLILDPNKGTGDYTMKVDSTKDLPEKPPAGVGEYYVAVSEYWHKWSAEDARQNEQVSEAVLTAGRLPITNEIVLKANEATAAKLGVNPPPALYYASEQDKDTRAYSGVTKEGKRYIVLDPNDSLGAQLATLPHEMGHHALGHVDAQALADLHNSNQQFNANAREQERGADRQAVLACDGKQLADLLTVWHDKDRATMEANGGVYSAAAQMRHDPQHPLMEERIAALRAGAKEMEDKGACPVDPATLADALPGMKAVRGGQDVVHNDAPSAAGGKSKGPIQR